RFSCLSFSSYLYNSAPGGFERQIQIWFQLVMILGPYLWMKLISSTKVHKDKLMEFIVIEIEHS
ncbi:hypothetical protein TorRG33x02_318370, partial [Trema orientale]